MTSDYKTVLQLQLPYKKGCASLKSLLAPNEPLPHGDHFNYYGDLSPDFPLKHILYINKYSNVYRTLYNEVSRVSQRFDSIYVSHLKFPLSYAISVKCHPCPGGGFTRREMSAGHLLDLSAMSGIPKHSFRIEETSHTFSNH